MTEQHDDELVPRTDLSDVEVNSLCDEIRQVGYDMHVFFGPGFREKVYERSLINRLLLRGFQVQLHPRVMVYDEDGTELVEEILDLVVNRVIVIELKAVKQVTDGHVAQLLGYLKATSFRHGLLINFGATKFFIKKSVR